MKQLSLEEIRESQLETMVIFRDFCQRNHLRYYLAYGTLLGAVRHKGFIPWDNDVDIYMPREDYDYFIVHFNESAPRCRKVISKEFYPDYHLGFAKVVDGRTATANQGRSYEIGVWVDVFPLDYVVDDRSQREKANRIIGLLNIMLQYSTLEIRPGRAAYKNMIVRILKVMPPRNEWLLERRSRLVGGIVSPKKSATYGLLYQSIAIYGMPTAPTSMFEPAVQMAFEGELFSAPKEYDKILTYFYGRKYMTFPPTRKRVKHLGNAFFWKDAGNNA